MASVFAAWDSDRECEVAIKVLRPEFVATIVGRRFHREIGYLADLNHPNILPILDSGEADHLIYFTMPLAPGKTLGSRVSQEGPLSIEEAISITQDIAAAIDHAHTRNIIHRDIKPDNIVFSDSRALICDFGVARALVTAGRERLSSSGIIIGTPEYMSPEQASGEWDLSGAADIYALGCVVYMMLAGEPPFTGPTTQAILAKHAAAEPPSLLVVRPEVPQRVAEAVRWALTKEPRDRCASGAELVAKMKLQ
jgi:serine/threonine-protein kinase